jgi:uncharacterized membrane protein YukC
MKEFMLALLIIAGATSVAWWIGTGDGPVEQAISVTRHLPSASLLRRLLGADDLAAHPALA